MLSAMDCVECSGPTTRHPPRFTGGGWEFECPKCGFIGISGSVLATEPFPTPELMKRALKIARANQGGRDYPVIVAAYLSDV